MSRAFVKELDGYETEVAPPRRQHSGLPNYITPGGERSLKERIGQLIAGRQIAAEAQGLDQQGELRRIDDELSYLQERLEQAIVVAPPDPPWHRVEIGAQVELVDEYDHRHRFTILGEDEIDVPAGRISWSSPLGRAVMGKAVGEVAQWRRPVGDLEVEIVSISYPGQT